MTDKEAFSTHLKAFIVLREKEREREREERERERERERAAAEKENLHSIPDSKEVSDPVTRRQELVSG